MGRGLLLLWPPFTCHLGLVLDVHMQAKNKARKQELLNSFGTLLQVTINLSLSTGVVTPGPIRHTAKAS